MLAPALILAGTAGALLLGYLYKLTKPSSSDPPCPGSDPGIGSFRYLKAPLYRFMSDRYPHADLVLFFLGPSRVYYINSYAAFKEAMVDNADALSGRISQRPMARLVGDYGGIVGSDGELWKQYRRFTLQTLRDFGLGRRGAEHCISQEAGELCAELSAAAQSGQAIDIGFLLSRNTSNVICQLVFGSRLASESEEFAKIMAAFYAFTGSPEFLEGNFRSLAFLPLTTRFGFALDLLLMLPDVQRTVKPLNYLLEFCQRQIEQHQADEAAAGDADSEARDYIDAHLKHQRSTSSQEMFNNKRLCLAILDLFLAGTETTANTLRWALLFVLANPAVAAKVRAEIQQQLGAQGRVAMADKSRLNYTMATLEEVNRLASLVINGVIHRVTADIRVTGYDIPADSYVMYNMFHIHRDPAQFPEPHQFRPERHLDSEGRFQACQRLVTFGAGKRACLGESLARMELFIFFVSLMQRFSFRLVRETGDGAAVDDEASLAQEMLDKEEPHLGALIRELSEYKLVFSEVDSQ